MNIVHIITRLIIGGAQENTILTCRGLVHRGHRVTLIAGPETGPEGSLWPQAHNSGAEVLAARHLRRAVNLAHDALALSELTRMLRERAPDIVHTHSSKAGILGRRAARRARVPIIIHTIHGMSFNRTQSAPVRLIYRLLERRAARYTTKFIAVADAMIEQSVAAGLAPRDRFVTIPSGMDTRQFTPDPQARQRWRRAWGIEDQHVAVGTVARLFRNKGYEETIAAMPAVVAAAPHVRFVWIGGGPHRTRYEKRLERLGLRDRVTLTGLVPPEQVAEMMNAFDLVLHASRWEGLPRAVVQGLLLEKPAVCVDVDGAREVVHPDRTGLLAPLGDTQALVSNLIKLSLEENWRKKMGIEGRKLSILTFDTDNMVRKIADLYEELAG